MRWKSWLLLFATCALAVSLRAEQVQLSTPEAQALYENIVQGKAQWLSQYLLAWCQVIVGLTALSLLLNARSMAFLFLTCYGVVLLNIPYYVPAKFQLFFGFAIILIGIIGLLSRLLLVKRPAKAPATK